MHVPSVWLISLSLMLSGFIHFTAHKVTAFLFVAEYYSIVCVNTVSYMLSSIDGHSDPFHLLAAVNNASGGLPWWSSG